MSQSEMTQPRAAREVGFTYAKARIMFKFNGHEVNCVLQDNSSEDTHDIFMYIDD